jgi:hypothetical protein
VNLVIRKIWRKAVFYLFVKAACFYISMCSVPILVTARPNAWFAAARLLGLRVRIPPRAWMSVSCECCVLSGRGLCDGPITRPEESYRVWRV